jgi:hypothetical protein
VTAFLSHGMIEITCRHSIFHQSIYRESEHPKPQMDIIKSFTYIKDDKKWSAKLFIPGLFCIIPVLNFIWIGYTTSLMNNISQKLSTPLPEWRDVGHLFKTGFILSMAIFTYFFPVLLLGFLSLHTAINSYLNQEKEIQEVLLMIVGGNGMIALCCLSFYVLLLFFIFPSIHQNYSRQDTYKSCFKMKEIIQQISRNSADYIVAWMITMTTTLILSIASILSSILLVFIPCIGWILIFCVLTCSCVWLSTIYAYLFGQIRDEPSFTEQLLLER